MVHQFVHIFIFIACNRNRVHSHLRLQKERERGESLIVTVKLLDPAILTKRREKERQLSGSGDAERSQLPTCIQI